MLGHRRAVPGAERVGVDAGRRAAAGVDRDRGAVRPLHQREEVAAHTAVVRVADGERHGRGDRGVEGVAAALERDRAGLGGQGVRGRDRPLGAGSVEVHAGSVAGPATPVDGGFSPR